MLFDAYVAVDWSAANRPKLGRDSIWIAASDGTLENLPTRHEATERVRALLRACVGEGRRVLVGFDFPYGYPCGFAAAVAPGPGPGWRRVWATLARLIEDDERNASNRFAAAAELNARLGTPAFWGWPHDALPGRKPLLVRLAEFRTTELRLRAAGRRPKSVWQLSGAGSVGSQALLGIPRLLSLRDDPKLAPVSAVWPFEPIDAARVVHAEIWPGASDVPAEGHAVADARQVHAVVTALAAADATGRLASLLTPIGGEEGWILAPTA